MKVSLYVRERGTRKQKKHNPKKSYRQDGSIIWVLRYGKAWETLDVKSLSEATTLRLRRQIELDGGWRPQRKEKPHTETVLMLDKAKDDYLAETAISRKPKTYAAYGLSLRWFYDCTGNKAIKDIDRGDLLRYAAYVRDEKDQAPRSCYNKFENVATFLNRCGVSLKALGITSHDWPQYVEEEPEIYEQETLDKFFAACDEDERLLFEFFLMTGMREQEVIFATDRAVDFESSHVRVKHNPDYGWTPKMYKERTIPVPLYLTEKLKKTLVGRGKGGLLFPTANGKPKYDFLDMAKRIAKRAGIPEEEVWLHKFRATFCTRALWAGVDLRTVQEWMGHKDIASTMRYLKPQRGAKVQQMVEAIWGSA
jgi:integrase/recombinase XerD